MRRKAAWCVAVISMALAARAGAQGSFGVLRVARAEAPDTPISDIDIGALPRPGPISIKLQYRGSFPPGARARVRCQGDEDWSSRCLLCWAAPEAALADQFDIEVKISASPFCQRASESSPRPVPASARVIVEPKGTAVGRVPVHALPLRATLAYPPLRPIAIALPGGGATTIDVAVPVPHVPVDVLATFERGDAPRGIDLFIDEPRVDLGAGTPPTPVRAEVRVKECCAAGRYRAGLRLTPMDYTPHLDVPISITVTDPGFWVCPGVFLLRIGLYTLGLLALSFVIFAIVKRRHPHPSHEHRSSNK